MIARALSAALVALVLGAGPFGGMAFGADFPAVDGAKVDWVSKSMVVNGIRGAFRTFDSDKSVDKVLEFYRDRWRKGYDGKPGYREGWLGQWKMISRLEGGSLKMVQVMGAGRGSTGYLSESDLNSPIKGELGSGVPRMDGSLVLNEIINEDGGRRARTLMISNDYSVKLNGDFYRRYYKNRGWKKVLDAATGPGSRVLAFIHRDEEASLSLKNTAGKTAIVANLVGGD